MSNKFTIEELHKIIQEHCKPRLEKARWVHEEGYNSKNSIWVNNLIVCPLCRASFDFFDMNGKVEHKPDCYWRRI